MAQVWLCVISHTFCKVQNELGGDNVKLKPDIQY